MLNSWNLLFLYLLSSFYSVSPSSSLSLSFSLPPSLLLFICLSLSSLRSPFFPRIYSLFLFPSSILSLFSLPLSYHAPSPSISHSPSIPFCLPSSLPSLSTLLSQTYGHVNVSILDGGLPKWLANGYPTVSGPPPEYPIATYRATFHPELIRDYDQMMENRTTKKEQVGCRGYVVWHTVLCSLVLLGIVNGHAHSIYIPTHT